MARLLLVLVFIALGCTHNPVVEPNASIVQPLPAAEYKRLIESHTRKTDQYSGFYQTFQAAATILSSEVQTAMLKQKGAFLQWDQRTYQTERDKTLQEATAYAKFFLRFYSPENDYDDLDKGKTIWKVYLEYGGSRFEGKVRKMKEKAIEVKNVIPYMDGFSTPYEVTFNVPMATIENGEAKFTLTSSLGATEFKFKGSNQ